MDLESFNLCRSSPHTLSTDSRVYKIGVYYLQLLHSISNQARYCSVLFSWNLLKWTTRNAHLSENDPPKPIKSLKMTPSKMPPSLTANKRPALNTRLNVFLFFFLFALVLPLACGHRRIPVVAYLHPQKNLGGEKRRPEKMSVCAG